MNKLIQLILSKYAGEMDISPEKKLEMLIDILTIYLSTRDKNE